MSEDLQAKLMAGVEAVRRGDMVTARSHLQAVLAQDPNNEIAWMWLASTVNAVSDRRRILDRVLQINPNNQTAREALARLPAEDTAPGDTQSTVRQPLVQPSQPPPIEDVPPTNPLRLVFVIVGAIVVIGGVVAFIFAITNAVAGGPNDATLQAGAQIVFNPTETPIPGPTLTPSETPIFGVIVSLNPPTLPPTFTPTALPTATETPLPSPTPPPLSNYSLFYSSVSPESAQTALYSIRADGSADTLVEADVREAVISPDGTLMVFVRVVDEVPFVPPTLPPTVGPLLPTPPASPTPSPTPEPIIQQVSELFIAPVDNLAAARQLTNLQATLSRPAWSADGGEIAFVANGTDLYTIPSASTNFGEVRRLLNDRTGNKTDLTWSPAGDVIVYASDFETPGFNELYSVDLDTADIARLTDDTGSTYAPVFSPDGSQLVFVSDRGGDGDLFIANADGSSAFLLTIDDDGAEDRTPAFSPDGRFIAFSSLRDNTSFQIFLYDMTTETVEQVTTNDRDNDAPSFRLR